MLAGNADRDRGVDVLRAAFSEGRLTKEEYDYRVGRAMEARTIEELRLLTGDVPNGPGATPPPAFQPLPAQGQLVPFQAQPMVPFTPPVPNNRMAIASLICGLSGPLVWGLSGLPALILGHMARAEIRRTGERGAGVALAGLMLGWTWIGLLLFMIMIIVV
jgi:hypothetical protein